jgi:Flp pilus assembly protein TadG
MLSRFTRSDDGAVAVEFVLIAPLLITLVFGIICFGYLFGISHGVQQLAVETARASVQGLTQAERLALAHDYLDRASIRYPLLRPNHITRDIAVSPESFGNVSVTIVYNLEGSIVGLANDLLRLNLTTLQGRAYLDY